MKNACLKGCDPMKIQVNKMFSTSGWCYRAFIPIRGFQQFEGIAKTPEAAIDALKQHVNDQGKSFEFTEIEVED